MPATQGVVVSFVAAAILTLSACVRGNSPSAPPATSASPASAPATERLVGPLTEAEAGVLSTMNDGVKDYVKLHIKIERSLPKLPKDATPEEIDKNQGALQKKGKRPGRPRSPAISSRPRRVRSSNAYSPLCRRVRGPVAGGQHRPGDGPFGEGVRYRSGVHGRRNHRRRDVLQRHFAPGADRRLGYAQAPQGRALIPRDQPNVPCGAEGVSSLPER